jgi:hypothetical protein
MLRGWRIWNSVIQQVKKKSNLYQKIIERPIKLNVIQGKRNLLLSMEWLHFLF